MRCKHCSEVRRYHISAAIWWRCDRRRYRRAIRRQLGGRESGSWGDRRPAKRPPRGGLLQLKLTQGHRYRRPSYPRKVPLPGPCDLNRCAQNDLAGTTSSSPMKAYASSGLPDGRLTICSLQGLGGSNRSKPAGTPCADAGAIGAVAATNAVDPTIKHMNVERKSNRVMIVSFR